MPITLDKRVKKKNGVARYRVRINYTDSYGKARQVERLVWGRAEAEMAELELETEYKVKRSAFNTRMTVEELFVKYSEYHVWQFTANSAQCIVYGIRSADYLDCNKEERCL